MRKLFLSFSLLLIGFVSFGQAVNESAIIPVSVTMNTVSRLTIESGGNIKFVFNSINDYANGFDGSATALYTTSVAVSSSTDFSIDLYAEGDFQPTDNAINTLTIGQLEYQLLWTGALGNTPTDYTNAWTEMTAAPVHVIDNITTAGNGGIAGDGTANRFDIQWRIGTAGNTLGTFLTQGNIAADHYVANIFIELIN